MMDVHARRKTNSWSSVIYVKNRMRPKASTHNTANEKPFCYHAQTSCVGLPTRLEPSPPELLTPMKAIHRRG